MFSNIPKFIIFNLLQNSTGKSGHDSKQRGYETKDWKEMWTKYKEGKKKKNIGEIITKSLNFEIKYTKIKKKLSNEDIVWCQPCWVSRVSLSVRSVLQTGHIGLFYKVENTDQY